MVEHSLIDRILDRATTYGDLATAVAPYSAVLESIVEDVGERSACDRDIEAAVEPDALLRSSTPHFPMTRLAAGMHHPERAIVLHPVQTQLIIFAEVVAGERAAESTVTDTLRCA
jgi:3-hydroxyacyl-CoA dehydrogenase